jgi:hypothetical protein
MIQSHISKLRINVRNTIKDYLPIDNLYVGSYGKPNCNWNPLNESEDDKEKKIQKNLTVLRKLISMFEYSEVCDMWVDYHYEDDDYIIRSKMSTKNHNTAALEKEFEFLEDSIESLGFTNCYVFRPYYVENCENELNESEDDKEKKIQKNLKAIRTLLDTIDVDGLCEMWVEYNPEDGDYEIRSKTTRKYLDMADMVRELGYIDDTIRSWGMKTYVYSPWYVENCEDEVEFMSESLNESEKDTKKLFKITKMIMEDMILPEYNHIICSYEITLNEVFNIPEVTVLFIGGYGTKLWPMTQGIRQMYLDVLEDISKEIANYTGVVIGVRGEQTPKCDDKENIYLRESESEDKDYSPAGKEITPNHIVVHKSNPMFRDKIMENGLKVRAGECYKVYVGYGVKCKPAIFATNSTNKRAWFDSTYDDDIWFIDTTMIPDVKWFKDRHFESRSKHIVTFQDIPKEAITLKYEGTGSSEDVLNSWPEDSPNRLQETIRRILRENSLKNDLNESEEKQPKLLSTIEEDGLFQMMQDTGLSLKQIKSKIGELPREVFERYIKDFLENDEIGWDLSIQISPNKIVDSFYLSDGVVTIEVNEVDSRGRVVAGSFERLFVLSDEEIFSLVDEMSQINFDNHFDLW